MKATTPSLATLAIEHQHGSPILRAALLALATVCTRLRNPAESGVDCPPVNLIEIEFDGSVGAGTICEIRLVGADWKPLETAHARALCGIQVEGESHWQSGPTSLDEVIRLAALDVLEIRHSGWEHEEGAFGVLEFRLQVQADQSVLPSIGGHIAVRELTARAVVI